MCSQNVAVLKRDMVTLLWFCLVWKHTDCLGISWHQCFVQGCPFWANIRKNCLKRLMLGFALIALDRLFASLSVRPSVRLSVAVMHSFIVCKNIYSGQFVFCCQNIIGRGIVREGNCPGFSFTSTCLYDSWALSYIRQVLETTKPDLALCFISMITDKFTAPGAARTPNSRNTSLIQ